MIYVLFQDLKAINIDSEDVRLGEHALFLIRNQPFQVSLGNVYMKENICIYKGILIMSAIYI